MREGVAEHVRVNASEPGFHLTPAEHLPDPVVGESPALAKPEPRFLDVRVAFTVILLLPAHSYSRLSYDFRSP